MAYKKKRQTFNVNLFADILLCIVGELISDERNKWLADKGNHGQLFYKYSV